MILLREVDQADLDGLEALSQIAVERHPGFLNLVNDREQWKEKIQRSIDSFSEKIPNKMDGKYIFVSEDLSKSPPSIVGVSMITAQHGTPESPHFFFDVGSVQKYSQTINTGFIHGTIRLRHDMDGPTEIGGLLVHPDYRNHEERIGRQVSFIRFLYIGLHKSKFKRRFLAELLPPLTKKGKSPLWEAVGRRFTNMEYTEADILSAKNKEFILSLFPTGKMYITFLSAEARNAIGRVSKETEPVMHMLKKIGFQYRNQVDPFDGGPHLMATLDDILPIKCIRSFVYGGDIPASFEANVLKKGLACSKQSVEVKFKAVSVTAALEQSKIYFEKSKADAFQMRIGDSLSFMPYY